MSDVPLSAVLRAFDVCVIEYATTPPKLRLLTPSTGWLVDVFGGSAADSAAGLGDATPFLENFMPDAEAAWHEGRDARATSGPFVVPTADGDVMLRALAITHDGRRLLMLQRLTGDADLRPMLQRAREQMLEQEKLVRQVGAVHGPAAAIERDLKELHSKGLPQEHHALVERLMRASTELQTAVATLPAPPSRHRRQAKTK